MAQALMQLGQIASQMAMQLGDQQSAAMIQQIAMQVGGQAAMPGLPAGNKPFAMPQSEADAGGITPDKHPFVKKAEKQSEEATRPQ